MLTIYYVAATWLQSWRLSSALIKVKAVRRRNGSIIIHHELPPYIYMTGPVPQQKLEVDSVLSKKCSNYNYANVGDLLWFAPNKRIVSIYPMQCLDISGWIAVIPGRTHLPIQFRGTNRPSISEKGEKLMLLLEADYNTCQFKNEKAVLEIEDYGTPIAWHVRENLSLLVESDEESLASLCVAFQNNIALENGIQIIRIESVKTVGHPYQIQNIATVPETYAPLDPGLEKSELKESFMSRWRAHVSMLCTFCDAVHQVKDSLQDISVRHPGSGVGAVKLIPVIITDGEDLGFPESSDKISVDDMIVTDSSITTSAIVEPSTPSSGVSISRMSTDTLQAPGSTKLADSLTTSMSSLRSLPTTPRRTINTSASTGPVKPPNIIVFSDSSSAADSVKAALEATISKDRYTIHVLSCSEISSAVWLEQASLVVIHGNVPPEFTSAIIDFLLLASGSVLCLCSDLLGSILPVFHTAEVRPNELIHCSYKTWKHVPLMHHVFCYQPSPPAPQFSHDNSMSAIPASVELKDKTGKVHRLKVEMLGAEETWQTPSLLLLSASSSAKIVFSQVHLEVEPGQYESDEKKRLALEKSDKARLEILCDVLSNHLGIHCSLNTSSIKYFPAYFLGNHELKQQLVDELQDEGHLDSSNSIQSSGITLKFCGKGVTPPPATSSLLPVLMYSCPESFSTVLYFENLKTKEIGRLVLYSQVMTTSMAVVRGPALKHGFTVIPKYQTKGEGRGGNTWLSPDGCAMFTVQMHIPLDSYIGQHLSILQNICGLAIVAAICQYPGLEELDIGLKWPNDIYAHKSSKIGGVVVKSLVSDGKAICNIGCALNFYNSEPTICIHDMIKNMNKAIGGKIPLLEYEKYFAIVFNKLEELYNLAQSGHIEDVHALYYNYWLHSNAEIEVRNPDGGERQVRVKGIDEYGFLVVESNDGKDLTVHPDGNTFDMMSGLIIPKLPN